MKAGASSVRQGGTAAEQAGGDHARDRAAGPGLLLAASLFDEGVSLPAATAEDLHRLPVRDGSGDITGNDRDRAARLGIAKSTTCEQSALEHQRQSTANLSRWAGSRPHRESLYETQSWIRPVPPVSVLSQAVSRELRLLRWLPDQVRDFPGLVPEASSVPVCKGPKNVGRIEKARASRDVCFW